jgi:probable HAF family extracellular repeat protein
MVGNSAINDAGQIVGSYGGAPNHAFITGPDGMGLSDLGTLDGRRWSFARDFNDAGQVVFEKLYGCRICNPCRTSLRAAYYFRS